MHRPLLVGYIALALAQAGISINVVTSKYLLNFMPMFMLLASRFFISSVILSATLFMTKTTIIDPRHPEGKLSFNDWAYAILQGVFAAFLFNLLFVWGLQHTTATAAGIVGSTLPAIIALCAIWMLNERLNLSKVGALFLAMLGILIINLDHFEGNLNTEHTYFGDVLVFLAMIPEAMYSILSRKLARRMTPLGVSLIANLVGFITLLPCALITNSFDLSVFSSWEGSLILVAAISSLIFFWAWAWGLTLIPASTGGIFGGIMPVVTTLLAICFLDEYLHWYDIAGIGLVLASIVIGTGWRPAFLKKKALTQTS
ncbi:MAG: DMT family transporter [Proteobacteria bacterium]|nr:DMT family transporter [Pseudomonadota bacterium]